jgi:hypothetical protein
LPPSASISANSAAFSSALQIRRRSDGPRISTSAKTTSFWSPEAASRDQQDRRQSTKPLHAEDQTLTPDQHAIRLRFAASEPGQEFRRIELGWMRESLRRGAGYFSLGRYGGYTETRSSAGSGWKPFHGRLRSLQRQGAAAEATENDDGISGTL